MNTEINLLEKQSNKYIPFLKMGLVLIILLVCVFALILVQKSNYESEIVEQKSNLAHVEKALKKQQGTINNQREQQRLSTDIQAIKSISMPTIEVYNRILELLPETEQLITYESLETNQVTLQADFKSLTAVSEYVSALLKQKDIMETELTMISHQDSIYKATLTISIDPGVLAEEDGGDE
ncbi:hypothetical protein CFK37_12860 [Virgibacillus phasianinus]|uniref:Fimbrial protein n=1 Tax=Virgibacillus phasianinus TaxID=2017483 RepID=A0A220U4C5_9BACI|nr:hypothetical protein [Virgibacillus phasianinus]ASK62969.1 hypothetical protein CFK37_12860 [Virgibacillus phasianinus]